MWTFHCHPACMLQGNLHRPSSHRRQLAWVVEDICATGTLKVNQGDVRPNCLKPRWSKWVYYLKTGRCNGVKVLPKCACAVTSWVTTIFPFLSGPSTHRLPIEHFIDGIAIFSMDCPRKRTDRALIQDFLGFSITDTTCPLQTWTKLVRMDVWSIIQAFSVICLSRFL